MKSYLTYEQFGAKGDGTTDDFEAIIACHTEANRTHSTVRANDGATYYIGGRNASAVVMTDVNFGKAKFIIDDRHTENRDAPIFSVECDSLPFSPDIRALKKGQTHVDFTHDGNVFVTVKNVNKRKFIRKGLNANAGLPTQDSFIVNSEGKVFPSIDWDYEEVTDTYAVSLDNTPITLRGGIFTTISNAEEPKYHYFWRNIRITRPNVTVEGLEHYMTDVPEAAAPYRGFIQICNTANITLKDCLLTPRLIYKTDSAVPGKKVNMGSYGIGIVSSVNVHCTNIRQTIDIHDTRYWGLVYSYFCKELWFDNCTISRFDAHEGVTNVKLTRCTFGHQCVNLIGFGKAYIEDCHIYGNQFVALRGDYGSVFFGDIIVKNSVWHPTNKPKLSVFFAYNTEDHDFGYDCAMPNITIDGLTIADSTASDTKFFILPDYNPEFTGCNTKYPYKTIKTLRLKNVRCESGNPIEICDNPLLYKDLTLIEE